MIKNSKKIRFHIILIITLTGFFSGCTRGETDKNIKQLETLGISTKKSIIIGGPLGRDPQMTYQEYIPWLNYIEEKMDIPVEMVFSSEYDDMVNRMRNNELDVVFMNPLQYALSLRISDYKMLLTRNIRGGTFYQTAIISHSDWGFLSLSDLRNKTIGFVTRDSTTGFYVPLQMLQKAGLASTNYISYFFGNHESVVKEVISKKIHAGAIFAGSDGFHTGYKVLSNEPSKLNRLTTLAVSMDIPCPVIVFSQRFMNNRKHTAEHLIQILLNINNNPQGKLIMQSLLDEGLENSYSLPDEGLYMEFIEKALQINGSKR
ncbi:phosphate/phosphite/phosphonate ABC transporter substrate-binding protein [Elusimicrobiota bacterium]